MAHGKSTLARLIAGIDKPTTGDILVDEINTKDKKQMLALRKKVGMILQNPENQIIFNRVYDDIAFGMKNLGYDKQHIRQDILECLKMVETSEYINSDSYELSLGQKQRIAIASVLAMNPKTIVFDEPTAMIDPQGKEKIYEILKNLNKQGYTIIYITNVVDEILLSDRIIVLKDGILQKDFKKKDIIDNVDLLLEQNLKIPTVLQMVLELNKKGINLELSEFSNSEFVSQLLKEIQKW